MEIHNIEVKFYSEKEEIKKIEVSAAELEMLEKSKALSSNIELEKSVMSKLTGLSYKRKKVKIIVVYKVKVLLSIY